jgi:hypothetical protein
MFTSLARAQDTKEKPRHVPPDKDRYSHVMLTPDEITWQSPPPATGLPPSMKVAILQGDPTKAGDHYTMRIWHEDGFKVPPHRHVTDENVVVIQGTFLMGVGETYDETAIRALPVGSYARMGKGVPHFALCEGETVVEVHGVGPFVVNLVNPKDPFQGARYKQRKGQD